MATAPQERLDPVVSLAPPPAADETVPPPPSLADGATVVVADAVEVVSSPAGATTPSGFPALGLAAAVIAHVLIAAAFYLLVLRDPPEEFKAAGEVFEIELAQDKSGNVDGTADRAPDGAPRPDDSDAKDARAKVVQDRPQPPAPPAPPLPQQPPTPAASAAAPSQPQPPSFAAKPMPVQPPVPDTADAWAPRVQVATAIPPAPPPSPSTPPAAAKPPPAIAPRPSLQRSVDLRNIPGHAPHSELAAGTDNGGPESDGYGGMVFRAIDRVRFYPPRAHERGDEGRVLLRVIIGPGGKLVDALVVISSGVRELDAATIEMAHRAHYPPLPYSLASPRSFDVPIHFGIRNYRR